jgi:Glyoxalase-like domain
MLAAARWQYRELPVAVSFQLVIGCADSEPLARFWAAALEYELEPPPDGFASWDAYRRDLGVPEDELGTGADCIVDPGGRGPRIWFQVIPDRKAAKYQLHLYTGVTGGRAVLIGTRRQRAGAEAGRLTGLGAELAGVLDTEAPGHYAVAMKDPPGNESGIN